MTKGEFIELVKRSLPLDHGLTLVEYYVGMAYDSFVKSYLGNSTKTKEHFSKLYQDIEIERDNNTEFYYSILPADILKVSRPGSGVWTIETTASPSLYFIPLPDMTFKIIHNLTALKIPTHVPYVVLDNKVHYRVKLLSVDKVNMRLFVPFKEYGVDEEINFPDGVELRIRDLVYNFMGQHPKKDMVIDANEMTR